MVGQRDDDIMVPRIMVLVHQEELIWLLTELKKPSTLVPATSNVTLSQIQQLLLVS